MRIRKPVKLIICCLLGGIMSACAPFGPLLAPPTPLATPETFEPELIAPDPEPTIAPTPEPTPEPEKEIQPALSNLYAFNAGTGRAGIISGDGKIIVPVEFDFANVLYDGHSTNVVALDIGKQQIDPAREHDASRVMRALYSPDGEAVTPFEYAYIAGASGSLVAAWDYDDNCFILKLDGTVVQKGGPDDKLMLGADYIAYHEHKASKLTFFNDQGELGSLSKIEDIAYYLDEEATLLYAKRNGKWGFVKPDGTVAIDFKYDDIRPFAGCVYAVVTNAGSDNETTQLINESEEVLFETTLGRITDHKNGFTVVYYDDEANPDNSGYYIFDASREQIGEEYGSMDFYASENGLLAITAKQRSSGDTGKSILLRDGDVLELGLEEDNLSYVVVGPKGNEIIAVNHFSPDDAQFKGAYGADGKSVFPPNKYAHASELYRTPYLLLSFADGRYDIADSSGNIILRDIWLPVAADSTRLQCTRGFERGIMDYNGNWIYSQSVFDTFDD